MKLYELTGQWLALRDSCEDTEVEQIYLATLEGQIEDKAQGIGMVLKELESTVDALKAEESRLRARRSTVEAKIDWLRDYMKAQMELMGKDKIKTPLFSWSLSDGPARVVITDEALIPEYFWKVIREPSKTLIQEAYKNDGEVVPGTEMQRSRVLRFK